MIERGAVVRSSIVMHGCRIGAGAIVDHAILDKEVTVGPGAVVGTGEPVANARQPGTLSSGITVVGKAAAIPSGARIGRGCIIGPDLAEEAVGNVASGATVLS